VDPAVAADRSLDADQLRAWKALVSITQLLPGALDRQLRADSRLTYSDYVVLATLSAAPESRLRMSDLAALMDFSQSRLSHAMRRIEEAQWVKREPSLEDKRVFFAVLTNAGRAVLADAAPGHDAHIRKLVFEHLTAAQVRQLGTITERIVAQLVQTGSSSSKAGPSMP
jgi:DNA-binding MarR family transcriptional regulator